MTDSIPAAASHPLTLLGDPSAAVCEDEFCIIPGREDPSAVGVPTTNGETLSR